MKILIATFFSIWPIVFFAQNSVDEDYFAQLCNINKQWLTHQQESPNELIHFETDEDAIQAHLLLVCNSLSQHTPTGLGKKELTSRLHLIQVLREYALKKVFPTNLHHSIRTPYFVDDFDVHCAVGYLMSQSGNKNLVAEIRANENYSYIADIKTLGVAEWASEHGFTVDELKWIQPAYSPSNNIHPIDNGTNGSVKKILASTLNSRTIIAGVFDSLDLSPCLNIGQYLDNQLSCLGNGLSGIINDISENQMGVIAYGQFEKEGNTYTMAIFSQGTWQYINIPTREGVVATAGFTGGGRIEVVINHPTEEGVQEIWFQSTSATWKKELTVNGIVNQIGASPLGRVFAGKFDEATTFDEQGEASGTVMTNNVIFRNHFNNNEWEGINGTEISDTVKAVLVINNQIYFGGIASKEPNSSGVVLARYLNNVLQPILLASSFSGDNPVSINSINFGLTNGSLIIGGQFHIIPMIGVQGNNLASYDVFNGSIKLIANLNNSVNTIASRNSEIYIGGDFTTNLNNVQLNHLGKINSTLKIDHKTLESTLNVFPNPFTDIITIEGTTSSSTYHITDKSGRILKEGYFTTNPIIELSDLPNGAYLLNVQNENGIFFKQLIKQ